MNKVNVLINILKLIDEDTTIEVVPTNETYDISHPLVIAARYLADSCLIGDDGHPIGEEMDEVREAGFPIFPGEMDRFGWLTGCIELSRGLIIFG